MYGRTRVNHPKEGCSSMPEITCRLLVCVRIHRHWLDVTASLVRLSLSCPWRVSMLLVRFFSSSLKHQSKVPFTYVHGIQTQLDNQVILVTSHVSGVSKELPNKTGHKFDARVYQKHLSTFAPSPYFCLSFCQSHYL